MSGLPHWLRPEVQATRGRQAQQARSAAQEATEAARLGGRVQPGSGTSWRAKGDVKSVSYLDECKMTMKDSYSLKKSTWLKIRREAHSQGREPRMVIEIDGLTLEVTERE